MSDPYVVSVPLRTGACVAAGLGINLSKMSGCNVEATLRGPTAILQ